MDINILTTNNVWKDDLLNYLINLSSTMNFNDEQAVILNYGQVKRIIKGLILENVNVDLSQKNILDAIELRRNKNR